MYLRSVASAIALIGVLAGCVTVTSQTPPPASLPAPSLATVPASECHPVAVTGVVRSDPADPRAVWLETTPQGQRVEVVWPVGYWAEWKILGDELYLQVYDSWGRPFMTTTDIPSPNHTCESGRPNTVLLMQTPPDAWVDVLRKG
jgi:hypothetical protein